MTGQAVAATTGQPLNGVSISVMETELGVLTNAQGRFLINRVPAGTYMVQAVSVGYRTATREVTVPAGGAAAIQFEMEVSAVAMDELIVTGTAGAVERRKLGTSAASLDVSAVSEVTPLSDFSQTLEGRIPGLRSIGTVGGVGAGRELRIRGTDSFSLGQRPVIYIDGVRMDSRQVEWGSSAGGSTTCCAFSGGAGEDRLSDLNPDEIDRIEVLKGPSAATLYGSEASGGVIQIFTKRGRSNSPASFNMTVTTGFNRHRPNFPTSLRSNFYGADGTVPWDPNETLIENGLINSYDLTVDGGGEDVTYFVSGGFSFEEGSVKPNDQKKANLRVNLNWTAGDNLTVRITSGYVRNRIYSLQSGNNWLGIYTNALLANPLNATVEEPYGGGLDVNVADAQAIQTYSDADRWTGSIGFDYNPMPNFSHRATIGLDAVADQKTRYMPFGRHYTYLGRRGERNIGYRQARKFTGEYVSNLDWELPFLGGLGGTLAFGGQGYWDLTSTSMATGRGFAGEGVTTVSGAAENFGGETWFEEVNLGGFVQNRFDFNNLFITAAVRIDGNSAFGENYGFQVYPKADFAYNLSEDMLPSLLSSAKIRGAVGVAGKAPGPFDQFQTYVPNTVLDNQPGVAPSNPGNSDLEPETKIEYEGGLELGLWNDRISAIGTYWHALTQNALLGIALPPSEGFGVSRRQNVGEILNRGIEASLQATIIDTRDFRWNAGVNYEWIHNEILDLGETAVNDSIPIYSDSGELLRWDYYERLGGLWVGLPIFDTFSRVITGWDPTERRHLRSQFSTYVGDQQPNQLGSLFSDFAIGQSLRVAVQFRGEWGAVMSNSDRSYGIRQLAYDEFLELLDASKCTQANCKLNDLRTPASDSLLDRTRLVSPVDKRDHIRLQEVTIAYTLPESLTSSIGLGRSSLALAGYNLHWWDDCNCPDPNQQYRGGDDFSTSPFLGLPQPRRFQLTFRTRF